MGGLNLQNHPRERPYVYATKFTYCTIVMLPNQRDIIIDSDLNNECIGFTRVCDFSCLCIRFRSEETFQLSLNKIKN